jgi:uncharacterized protein (TIGR02099 family)
LSEARPPSRLRRLLGQLRALLLTAVAVVIILTAVIVGLGRALIPYADELRPWLADQISQRLDQPVEIERLDAQWPRLTPQLTLHGTRVGPHEAPLLEIDLARLELHLPDLLTAERNPFRLIVLGLDLVLAEDEAGQWGLELEGGAELAERPERDGVLAGDLLVRDARLTVRPSSQPEFATRLVEGEIRRRGDQTLVQGRLEPGSDHGHGVDFSLLLAHPDGHWSAARAWAAAEEVMPGQWLDAPWLPDRATLSFEAWLDWSADAGGRLDMDLGVNDGNGQEMIAEVLLSRGARVSQLELVQVADHDRPDAPWLEGLAVARSAEAWAVAIEALDLALFFERLRPWLPEDLALPAGLEGRIDQLEAGWRPGVGLHALRGKLPGLALDWPDGPLEWSGLDLALGLDGDRVVLEPSGQPQLRWPDLFRDTLRLEGLGGRALLGLDAIELDKLWVEADFVSGRADGWIYRGPERPFLDLVIHADRVESVDPRPWLTPRWIPENALQWLDDSLTWVGRAEGVVVLHMRAGKLASEIRPGDFQAEASFSGADIDYWPGWPQAEGLAGEVDFIGSGLFARVGDARLGGVAVRAPRVEVANLTEPEMLLEIESVDAAADEITGLLGKIPVPAWSAVLDPMQWSGPVEVQTRVGLPFRDMERWTIEGQATLADSQVRFPAWSLALSGLRGAVEFDREQIGPATLEFAEPTAPATLVVAASLAEPVSLRLNVDANPADLLEPDSAPGLLARRLHGQSGFQLDLEAAGEGELNLKLQSDLTGLVLDLPPPLTKPAAQAWPLDLRLAIDQAGVDGELSLAGWLDSHWRQLGPEWRLALGLNQPRPALPLLPGLHVRGQIEALALSDWLDVVPGPASPDELAGFEVDIALGLGRLTLFGLDLLDLDVSLARAAQAWQVELSGDSIEGGLTVPVPLDSGRVLVADLRHLYLEPIEADPEDLDLAVHPLSAQTSSQSPRGLPPLHLLIDDLRWGVMNLGRARLESHASAEGVEVELIDVSGPDLRLNGRGRWVEREDRIHSEFQGRLTTANLGGLLASAGYELGIEASRAQLDAELRWPGAPVDFSLARLSGELDLQMSDGVIPEARPGAGRLLGLASFSAIPRRLMLDFRDVFGAGLRFDEIRGRFDLAAGFARTEGVTIDSPAARITISGDTDMAAREYDQTIRIEPGLGATLPVIGVLAGGPVGAAAGLVLRQILDRPLRGLAEARYSVTGPWDDPRIELIEARVTDEQGEEAVLEIPELEPLPENEPEPESD